jgi:hypothetical protein
VRRSKVTLLLCTLLCTRSAEPTGVRVCIVHDGAARVACGVVVVVVVVVRAG